MKQCIYAGAYKSDAHNDDDDDYPISIVPYIFQFAGTGNLSPSQGIESHSV